MDEGGQEEDDLAAGVSKMGLFTEDLDKGESNIECL